MNRVLIQSMNSKFVRLLYKVTFVGSLCFTLIMGHQVAFSSTDPSPPESQQPSPSPSGNQIVFSSDRNLDTDLWVFDKASNQYKNLTPWQGSQEFSPDWSPDGSRIVFSSNRQSSDFKLWTIAHDGTNAAKLATGRGESQYPRWSPDGNKIAFASDEAGNQELWVMNADGTDRQQITSNPQWEVRNPSWSPNGQKLVFVGCQTASCNLFIVNLADKVVIPLTSDSDETIQNWEPDWGVNGILAASLRDGATDIFLINPDTKTQSKITEGGSRFAPRWDHSGGMVFSRSDIGLTGATNIWFQDELGHDTQITHTDKYSANVPNVIGLSLSEAIQKLGEAKLGAEPIEYKSSASIAIDHVISQSPSSGTTDIYPPIVGLVVSSGPPTVSGDLNADGVVNCADLLIIKASFGKKTSQPGFNPVADVNKDGIIDIRDLSIVSRQLPAGSKCK